MPIGGGCIVIGLTGAFGSGCTVAARHLRHERGFELVRLSDVLRGLWTSAEPPTRRDLQRIGDDYRRQHGSEALVQTALAELDAGAPTVDRIVVDGIRNVGEVEALRNRFGYRFTLLAVLASPEDRWTRIEDDQYRDKGLGEADFMADDARDRNEETPYGQQVELCIDVADIFLNNTSDVSLPDYKQKVLAFVDLATGATTRPPEEDEIFMHMAYSSSHSSRCLKRHVGAVILDLDKEVIGVGYNENPTGTSPCVDEVAYNGRCYRDIVRNETLRQLHHDGMKCPACGEALPEISGPPWRCGSCEAAGRKTDLEAVFFPDRAMSWCTAIHAEDRAIRAAAGRSLKGARLYTTTFPCFQCAEKVIQAGIREVVFTEVYPDIRADGRLELASVECRWFEGVRSSAFERLFAPVRPS
ncbi:MAG: deaminase [Acidimicrobiia bacterium]